MRPGIHPSYQPIVFRDKSADFAFLTRSTLTSSETIEWEDGNTYPVYDVEVSSASHPFWTGQGKILDTAAGWRSSSAATASASDRRTGGAPRAQASQHRKKREGVAMKVRASIRSLAKQPGSKVVRRRGHTYVINKKNPRLKARQG